MVWRGLMKLTETERPPSGSDLIWLDPTPFVTPGGTSEGCGRVTGTFPNRRQTFTMCTLVNSNQDWLS